MNTFVQQPTMDLRRGFGISAGAARFLLFLLLSLSATTAVWADSVDDEYLQRARALDATDVRGHFELARWLRGQEKWQLVAQECRHILRVDPNHKQARLLLDIAQKRLGRKDGRGNSNRDAPGIARGVRPLTADEVQKIRRHELYLDRNERVVLRIDRDALREFHHMGAMQGWVEQDMRSFFRRPRIEQAQLMLKYAPEKYGDAITIKSDPQRMHVFVREVQPIVLRGCGSVDCHGGPAGKAFRLLNGRSTDEAISYANFLALHEHRVGGKPLINRDQPTQSLLLSYGLPPAQVLPGSAHPTPIAAVFPSSNDRDYTLVLDWLKTLSIDRPDYGIKWRAKGSP